MKHGEKEAQDFMFIFPFLVDIVFQLNVHISRLFRYEFDQRPPSSEDMEDKNRKISIRTLIHIQLRRQLYQQQIVFFTLFTIFQYETDSCKVTKVQKYEGYITKQTVDIN